MHIPPHLFALAVFGLFVVVLGADMARGPVARRRVERFARRQQLEITTSNGNQVIAYLATTRHWRVAGLVGGALASATWSLLQSRLTMDFLTLFAGWFVGALLAEARVSHLSLGTRRAAALVPRRSSTYLSRAASALLPASLVISLIVAVATLVLIGEDRAEPNPAMLGWPALAIALTFAVWRTRDRVLNRPQPPAEPDVLAADDAIRSRSLHVLAGGGTALVLYCCAAQLGVLRLAAADPATGPLAAIGAASVLLIPVLGWSVATWTWRVSRPAPIGAA